MSMDSNWSYLVEKTVWNVERKQVLIVICKIVFKIENNKMIWNKFLSIIIKMIFAFE